MPLPKNLEDFVSPPLRYTAVSLFSGAGGLDLGLSAAGIKAIFANDIDPLAVETYNRAFGERLAVVGDIGSTGVRDALEARLGSGVDLVVGGPPCQGFSVAGKMDPDDPRSRHVVGFLDMVESLAPRAFIMENVKALAINRRWRPLRDWLFGRAVELGYDTQLYVVNSSDFDVPQARERMFLIGTRDGDPVRLVPTSSDQPPTVRGALESVPPFGEDGNNSTCTARVVAAKKPVMRKSSFAGMLFNGKGRPLDLNRPAPTLPATMGGNRTPIVDQAELDSGAQNWVVGYHARLRAGQPPIKRVPPRLRRLTVEEAAAIQTFPRGTSWAGSQNAQYRQIGNAVPPILAYHVGVAVARSLDGGINGQDAAYSIDAVMSSRSADLALFDDLT